LKEKVTLYAVRAMAMNVMVKRVSVVGRNSKMEQIETEAMINSLSHLQSYYQSRYEHYLVMATEAKEHRERVSLLLQDLLAHETHEENYLMEKPHDNKSIDALPPSTSPTELSSASAPVVDKDSFEVLDSSQMRKFLDSLSQAMSVIESISRLDSSKTLHQSYLHKILNLEMKTELSVDLVELYLESAITKGYLKLDEFDSSCYIAQERDKFSNSIQGSLSKPKKSLANRKHYNLPSSSKLKPTLLETVHLYIQQCSPTHFSIEDVINYLYSQQQQLNWSQTKKNKVRSSISNVLGRKIYLGKQWKRLKPGVYQPL
jgi:hypothetical protein